MKAMTTAKRSTPSWLRIGSQAALAAALGLGIAGCDGVVEGDVSTNESTGDRPGFDQVSDAVGSVTGRVTDTNGKGIVGAQIFVAGQTGTTGQAGEFFITGVPVVNAVGADGNIAQTLPVTVLPVGGTHLSATATVTPQAQIEGGNNNATVDGVTNPQVVFIDGFAASAGVIVIPERNTSIEVIARNSRTGQLQQNFDFFLDFQGLASTAQITGNTGTGAGVGTAVQLESQFESATTAADGTATISGLANDSNYILGSRGFTINAITNSTFGVGTLTNGTVPIATDAETLSVLVCDLGVTAKTSADVINPFIRNVSNVVFQFVENDGETQAQDSRINGAVNLENSRRGMLANGVRNNVVVNFSESMAASATDSAATLALDLTSNPGDGLILVKEHTTALSADGTSLTFNFAEDLAEQQKFELILLDGFFFDTANNPLVFNEQAQRLDSNGLVARFTLAADGKASNGLLFEGPFATDTTHPISGKGLALKTFTTINTVAQVPQIEQVCLDPSTSGTDGIIDQFTPTFEALDGDLVTNGRRTILNLNNGFNDRDNGNNHLPTFLGQALADAILDPTDVRASGADAIVGWQSTAVRITRTNEQFSALALQLLRNGQPQLIRNSNNVQNQTSKELSAEIETILKLLGIRIFDENGTDVTAAVVEGGLDAVRALANDDVRDAVLSGLSGVTSKSASKTLNLSDVNKFLPLAMPAGTNTLTVYLNQTTNQNNQGRGTNITNGVLNLDVRVGDQIALTALSDIGSQAPAETRITLRDCVPPNLALQRSYCLNPQLSTATSGSQFGNGVELVGQGADQGQLRILGYKTPELLDVIVPAAGSNTDGSLNDELFAAQAAQAGAPANSGTQGAAVRESITRNAQNAITAARNGAHDATRYNLWQARNDVYNIGFEATERVKFVGGSLPTHNLNGGTGTQLTTWSVVNPDANGLSQPTRAEFIGAANLAGDTNFDPDNSYLVQSTVTGTAAMSSFLNIDGDEVLFGGVFEDGAGNRNDGSTQLTADNAANNTAINTLLFDERVPPFVERARYDGANMILRFNEPVSRSIDGTFSVLGIDCNNDGELTPGVNGDVTASFQVAANATTGTRLGTDPTTASLTAASGTVAVVPVAIGANCSLGGAFNYAETGITDFNYPNEARDHFRVNISRVFDTQGNRWGDVNTGNGFVVRAGGRDWENTRDDRCLENGVNSPDFLAIDDVGPFVVTFETNNFTTGSASFSFIVRSSHPASNWFNDVDINNADGDNNPATGVEANTAVFPRDGVIPANNTCTTVGGVTTCNDVFIRDAFHFVGINEANIANTSTFVVTSSGQTATLTVNLNNAEQVTVGDTLQIDGPALNNGAAGQRFQGNGGSFGSLVSDLTQEQEEVEDKVRTAGNQ